MMRKVCVNENMTKLLIVTQDDNCGHATHDADRWKLQGEEYKTFILGKRKADHDNHDYLN